MHKSSFAHMQNFKEKYLSKFVNNEFIIFDLGSMDVGCNMKVIYGCQ